MLLKRNRKQEIADKRHVLFYLLRESGYSIHQIALMCRYDRSSIWYAIHKVNNYLELKDKTICALWDKVKDLKK
jgi:chromosomal replication initiation ATPase DnaA